MTQQYDKEKNKHRNSKILAKIASHMKSPKNRKSYSRNDNFKYPLNLEHLTPSAKLKAHLDYLTTQQCIPEPEI